jgi:hypothetical protein
VMLCHWNLELVVVHGKEKDSLVMDATYFHNAATLMNFAFLAA